MNCTFRKFVVLIIGALLLGLVSMLPIRTIKANYNTDVTCAFMDSTQYENVNAGGGYYQTFYPSESRLTSAVLTLAAFQTDSTATMKLLSENGTELATQSLTVTGADPVERHLYSFDGFDAVTVTPGAMYKLVLIKSAGTTLYWYKSTTCAIQGNGYANGTSFPGMDYVFTTYGYTPAEPAPTPEETQIAAPTKVTAEYVLDGNKVKVGWEKTTTEAIDGYRIYRSTDKTKGFAKVGQVVKEEKEFFTKTFTFLSPRS